uniref:Uncharacterized protein TCIL3000_8_2790 n=1 Tax=Trypanosoma congolense (strain IL3000) TaxID=1068625 RepID=G0URP8_TRYCI|nr:unnamed protein product [Trypanosoma congolense IL3000]
MLLGVLLQRERAQGGMLRRRPDPFPPHQRPGHVPLQGRRRSRHATKQNTKSTRQNPRLSKKSPLSGPGPRKGNRAVAPATPPKSNKLERMIFFAQWKKYAFLIGAHPPAGPPPGVPGLAASWLSGRYGDGFESPWLLFFTRLARHAPELSPARRSPSSSVGRAHGS